MDEKQFKELIGKLNEIIFMLQEIQSNTSRIE